MTNSTNDFHVTINGLDVHARYSERAVREIFLPFLREMTDLHRRKKKRVLVMLAAPPGAGKSTLLAYLEKLSAGTPGLEKIQTIGIDGFHRYQDYLLTHTTERGGEEIPMVKIKGAPITFDLEKADGEGAKGGGRRGLRLAHVRPPAPQSGRGCDHGGRRDRAS